MIYETKVQGIFFFPSMQQLNEILLCTYIHVHSCTVKTQMNIQLNIQGQASWLWAPFLWKHNSPKHNIFYIKKKTQCWLIVLNKQIEVAIHTEYSVFTILNKCPCAAPSRGTDRVSSEGPAVLVSVKLWVLPSNSHTVQDFKNTHKHFLTLTQTVSQIQQSWNVLLYKDCTITKEAEV